MSTISGEPQNARPFGLAVEGPPTSGLGPTLEEKGEGRAWVPEPRSSLDNVTDESSRILCPPRQLQLARVEFMSLQILTSTASTQPPSPHERNEPRHTGRLR